MRFLLGVVVGMVLSNVGLVAVAEKIQQFINYLVSLV